MRLLVVDDHEVVREGLRAVLASTGHFDVIDEAGSGASALLAAREAPPDVALVDYRLPDTTGDVLCADLRALCPEVRIAVVTTYFSEDIVRRSLAGGAHAYVTKEAGLGELRRVLSELTAGNPTPVDERAVLDRLHQTVANRLTDPQLTPRQVRVLELVATGLSYKQIAQQLFVSHSTVRFHVQNLKARLEVATVTELVAKAMRQSLIPPAP